MKQLGLIVLALGLAGVLAQAPDPTIEPDRYDPDRCAAWLSGLLPCWMNMIKDKFPTDIESPEFGYMCGNISAWQQMSKAEKAAAKEAMYKGTCMEDFFLEFGKPDDSGCLFDTKNDDNGKGPTAKGLRRGKGKGPTGMQPWMVSPMDVKRHITWFYAHACVNAKYLTWEDLERNKSKGKQKGKKKRKNKGKKGKKGKRG